MGLADLLARPVVRPKHPEQLHVNRLQFIVKQLHYLVEESHVFRVGPVSIALSLGFPWHSLT